MNLGTLVATLTAETSGLKRAVVDMGKFEKSISTASNKMVRQLGTVSAAMQRVDRNMAELASAGHMNTWEKKMLAATNKMVRQLGRVTNQTRLLRKEMALLAASAVSAQKAANRAAAAAMSGAGAGVGGEPGGKVAAVDSLGKRISTLSMRMRSFGWLATTVFTVPFIMGGAAVIKMGMQFEFAMAKIQGLVGINKKQVDEWSQALLDMGAKTAKGPQELADTLYYVASSGFKTNQALEITEMSAKGAATGLGETKDVANFLTSAMNAYRASGLSASRAMDILTAAVREGKGEPAEMARALGTILPIAAELGVSLDQVGGALAAMTLITSQTSNAATYLRNVLMKLMHPSAGTEKALKGMGSSVNELLTSLKDKGLMPTLMRLRELTDKYGVSMAKVFPNIRALLGALNLTGENMKYNEEVMKQVTESMGDFDKAFFIASGTVAFKWNAAVAGMKASLIELGVTLAKMMLPVMERWINVIKSVIDWYNNLSDPMQRLIGWFARVLAIIGPVTLVLSVFGMVVGTVTTALEALGLATVTFSGILAATGWGAFIIGAIAATAALIRHHKNVTAFARTQEKVNGILATEGFKMDLLFDRIKKAEAGTKTRTDAIEALNDTYGRYLPHLITEKDSLDDITKAQDAARKSLEAYIATKEMSKSLEELQTQLGEKFGKSFSKYIDTVREAMGPEFASDFRDNLNALLDEYNAFQQKSPELMPFKIQAKANKLFDDYIEKCKTVPGIMDKMKGKMVFDKGWFWGNIVGYQSLRKEVQGTMDDLNSMIGVYSGVYSATQKTTEANNSMYASIKNDQIKELMLTMERQEKMLNHENEILEGQGQEFDLAAHKADMYRTILEKFSALEILPEDKSEFDRWVGVVGEKLRALKGLSDETTESTSDAIGKIAKKYREDLKGLDYMNAYAKRHNKTFDYVTERTKLMEKTLQEVIEKGGEFSAFADELDKGLSGIGANTFDVIEVLKKLNESYAALDQRKTIDTTFDVNTAKLKETETAFEKLLELRHQMQGLDTTMVSVDFSGKPLEKAISVGELLDQVLRKVFVDMVDLSRITDDEKFQRSVDILNAQADAFGGVDMKLEVVSKRMERYRNELAKLAETEGGMKTQRWQDLIVLLQEAERDAIGLRNVMEKDYFKLLYDSLGAYDDKMQMVGADIEAVETRLKQLSAAPNSFKGWQDEVDKLIAKLGKLRLEAQKLESTKSMFSSLGSIFQDVGTEIDSATGDWIEWVGKVFSTIPELIDLYTKYGEIIKTVRVATELGTAAETANTVAKAAAIPVSALLAGTQAFSAMSVEAQAIATKQHTNELLKNMMTEVLANKIKQVGIVTSLTDTVVKRGEAVAGVTASGAKMPFPINLIAIALGIAAVITALATVIPKPRKMAFGGTVPPGFPNDSFPAMLTSGEEVIPNGKRKTPDLSKLEKTTAVLEGDVIFEIEGDRLVGILKKQGKKALIY